MTPAPLRFTVHLAGQARSEVEGLAAIAANRGLRPVFAEILRMMMANLETQPREWGDPYNNYPTLNAVSYERTVLPALVRVGYAVHNTEPLVWISTLRTIMGSPFESL